MGERREAQPMHPETQQPRTGPGRIDAGADQIRSRADCMADRSRQATFSSQRSRRSQKASQPQQSCRPTGQSDGQPERASHQNKKERLEGHSPRKNTAHL